MHLKTTHKNNIENQLVNLLKSQTELIELLIVEISKQKLANDEKENFINYISRKSMCED